ncbi:hypothetical protein D3C75_945790 [compost metagenome]
MPCSLIQAPCLRESAGRTIPSASLYACLTKSEQSNVIVVFRSEPNSYGVPKYFLPVLITKLIFSVNEEDTSDPCAGLLCDEVELTLIYLLDLLT